MRSLVLSWLVYQLTGSALALGYIGLAEALPYLASVLWAGELADRSSKRRLLFWAVLGQAGCSVVLAALALAPSPSLPAIYVVIGLTGLLASFETVSLQSYTQTLVPKADYPRAFAWHLALLQFSTVAGPVCAGFSINTIGAAFSLGIVSAIGFAASAATLSLKDLVTEGTAPQQRPLENIVAGLRFIRNKRVLWAPMVLDMTAILFGDVVAIFPVFASLLGVGPVGLGMMRAAPAVGSLVISTAQAVHPLFPASWKTVYRSLFCFGLSMICFAFSPSFWLSIFVLMLGGIADGINGVARQSVYQANTPDELRGRVSAVNGIFIRTSNEIGAFESGLAADLLGAVPSVIFGGLVAVGACVMMSLRFPNLEEPTQAVNSTANF